MVASAADFTDEYLRSWIEPDPETTARPHHEYVGTGRAVDGLLAGDGCGGR